VRLCASERIQAQGTGTAGGEADAGMAARRQNCFASLVSRADSLVHRNFPPRAAHCRLAWPGCLAACQSDVRGRPLGHAWQIARHKKSLSGERPFCTRDMFLDSDTDTDGQGGTESSSLSLSSTVGTDTDGMGCVHIVHGI
jgi:hypothetical protein